jgi:hypothetical protein
VSELCETLLQVNLNLAESTVLRWFDLFRQACFVALGDPDLPKMGGEGELVQVDEALMRGHKRKYGRSRATVGEIEQWDEERRKREEPPDQGENDNDLFSDDDDDPNGVRNYGDRVDGPWVLGISWDRSKDWQKEHGRGTYFCIMPYSINIIYLKVPRPDTSMSRRGIARRFTTTSGVMWKSGR